ncbi:glycosyltransferase [Thioalkalivibrio sp. ALMg9]|uniref:glycosyltransferase n=1 Tax=Thioalkalivibrio sp. ALMg9 TaxID=1266912 RepID=UPI00039E29F5|nr:glycosyltransferase [Thioalkalivibrio sp. ALMg9]
MKVLVLTKRHHMGMDAYAQLHGRSFAIPEILAEQAKAEIRGLVADYHPEEPPSAGPARAHADWRLIPIRSGPFPRYDRYWSAIRKALQEFRPDVVWAGADAPIVIIGQHVAAKTNIPCVIDLKDNYDSFRVTRIPGMRAALHRAIRQAHVVTCASTRLIKYARRHGSSNNVLLPNAADGTIFHPKPSEEARQLLGLPTNQHYIGTAGALTRDRNIAVLSEAARILADRISGIALLVAGQRDTSWHPPPNLPVYDLGHVSITDAGLIFNALDVGVICNIPGAFGTYCYPQKFHEMRACALPIVAARTGPFEGDLDLPQDVMTFSPNSPADLADRIELQLKLKDSTEHHSPATWLHRAHDLHAVFEHIARPTAPITQN